MKNSVRVLNICLFLGMTIFVMSANANDLNKLDIKRSSSSASTLNITVYTANPYDENIAVSKKSDNKYVILMPNVSGSNASNVDYSSIKDIVSDVDVKSVSDGDSSYTKVTLTTTKPVAINTSTRKSAPLTEEQKAYKNLIAQSRSAAANSKSASNTSTAPKSYVITADGISTDTSIRPKSVVEQVKHLIKDNDNKTVAKDNKPEVPTTSVAFGASSVKSGDNSLLAEKPIEQKKDSKSVNTKNNTIAQKIETENINSSAKTDSILADEESMASPLIDAINNNKVDKVFPAYTKKRFNQNVFTTVIMLLLSIFGILLFFKSIKKSLEHSAVLKRTFKENLHDKPHVIEDYSNITNDKSLNWQEKYHKFINSVGEMSQNAGALKPIGAGEYEFVNSAESGSSDHNVQTGFSELLNTVYETEGSAVLKPQNEPILKAYNKPAINYSPDSVPSIKKVKNPELVSPKEYKKLELVKPQNKGEDFDKVTSYLEKSYAVSPSVEKLNIEDDDIIKQLEESFKFANLGSGLIINDEDAISESLRKSPKLRSFANKIALEQTKRKVPSPKQRSEIIRTKYIEAKQVNMENSNLYSPVRKFSNANLSSADLLSSSNFKIASKSKVTNPINDNVNKNYSTVSVDEFFDTIDSSSKITASATLASRVADRLGKMSVEFIKPSERKKSKPQRNILTDKIVKTGYNIDDNSGFYIIENEDGTGSLVGRVNNDVTVLKNFEGGTIPDKLQVRQDSDNVYIVRAAGERYLVEMTEEKMAILLEL